MIEPKSLTPTKIALLISLFTTAICALALTLSARSSIGIALIFLVVFTATLILSKYMIEHFIHRKIKLIYKFIHQTKASKREEFFNKSLLPQQTIEEAGEEVLQWADQRKVEMEVLERNEAFRKEFLQNLAHEFKTPIFAIQGYLETLIEGAYEDPLTCKKFLVNAQKNTDRLIHLTSDLDEITRLESGQQEMQFQYFIVQELINEVIESLVIRTESKKISCSIKKGCDEPLMVFADKEKIRQVLINLIDNATKYGNMEGKIEASVYETDENTVLVEITDDGIGISEEHIPRVFERFYRTDYARSRHLGGTGLGLAICKHIVEAHGQIIHARSTPNIGTTFGFTLNRPKD